MAGETSLGLVLEKVVEKDILHGWKFLALLQFKRATFKGKVYKESELILGL